MAVNNTTTDLISATQFPFILVAAKLKETTQTSLFFKAKEHMNQSYIFKKHPLSCFNQLPPEQSRCDSCRFHNFLRIGNFNSDKIYHRLDKGNPLQDHQRGRRVMRIFLFEQSWRRSKVGGLRHSLPRSRGCSGVCWRREGGNYDASAIAQSDTPIFPQQRHH